MKTDELIAGLAADAAPRGPSLTAGLLMASAAALVIAAGVMQVTLGVRPDAFTALHTSPRFVFKFLVTFALFATALHLALRMARPGASATRALLWVPLALLVVAVAIELDVVPRSAWLSTLVGNNWLVCLTVAPLISLGPLLVLMLALKRGAPESPAGAGLMAGLAAGGIGTFFYAVHCPDDSPLFVAAWYSLVVAMMGALGALVGRLLLRW